MKSLRSVSALTFILIVSCSTWQIRESVAADADSFPAFFRVFSDDGRESLEGVCTQADAKTAAISCVVDLVRFILPNSKKLDEEALALGQHFAKAKPQEIDELNRYVGLTKGSLVGKIGADLKRSQVRLGPKTLAFLGAVSKAKTTEELLKLELQKKRQTCKIFRQRFALELKKIGTRKWASPGHLVGPCSQMTVYELRDETGDALDWILTETRVAAGKTDGICADAEADLHRPRSWAWSNPREHEIACDFVSHDLTD